MEKSKPFDYVYKEEGIPDRLVRFCCESCLDDFQEEPAKFLALIDAAAARKANRGTATGHESHQH